VLLFFVHSSGNITILSSYNVNCNFCSQINFTVALPSDQYALQDGFIIFQYTVMVVMLEENTTFYYCEYVIL